ncbi:helix-turn-helix transcriptional regulator [Sphingomonas sp. RRHST34]|uniref:Helix-turn-helix transcriptional regulator n=1 Tax=Sphingomonas citri TaxID=2862499 RepID=A0ABS7BSV9_9SPHN|nr:helix-turn-helix domain-containing protein [Sphingomonas citri]MBW6532658.1 helix-turn-helix transcriptional regulator [Sphingomonas citri]
MDMTVSPDQPGDNPNCRRVSAVLSRLGDKWTILAVTMLVERPRRFNELKRLIGGISQQMLTRTLKSLEQDGMVLRKVYPTIPPKVEYSLTTMGQSLSEPLLQLASWVLKNIEQIESKRASLKIHNDEIF